MDFILDLLIDFLLEDGFEASQNKKLPKGARYLILTIVILLYVLIIGLVIWFGIDTLEENVVVGIGILVFAGIFLVLCIIKSVNAYKKKQTKNTSNHQN